MISKQELITKIAETLNSGNFLDEFPSWIGEVQIHEDHIMLRIDDDYDESVWYKFSLS